MSRKWTPTCQNKTAYAFLAPSLLGLLVFVLLPFGDVIRRS
ncbi:sugar ABC transporter permease, partial [Blautia pseudococcoides]|nr:sugar ABC transporter permease [Blautia pseudococcoides]